MSPCHMDQNDWQLIILDISNILNISNKSDIFLLSIISVLFHLFFITVLFHLFYISDLSHLFVLSVLFLYVIKVYKYNKDPNQENQLLVNEINKYIHLINGYMHCLIIQ